MKGDTISTDIISHFFRLGTCDTHLKVCVTTPKIAPRAVHLQVSYIMSTKAYLNTVPR